MLNGPGGTRLRLHGKRRCCSIIVSSERPKMPDLTSRQKLRPCRFCGRPLNASDEASEACDECKTTGPQQVKKRSAEPATLAATGKSSSGEGEWITPSVTYLPGESSELDLPAKTNWRSPPFVIRFAEADGRDIPASPRAKPPSRLLALVKSRLVIAAFAILASGIVLISLYGVPKSLQLPGRNPFVGQPAAPRKDTTFQQQREAAFRQERDAKYRQQKAVAIPQHR